MLILREPRAVKARRGLLLPLFQRANLETFYPEMERYTSILLRQIEAEQKAEGNVDVFRWLRLVAFDIIGEVFLLRVNVVASAHVVSMLSRYACVRCRYGDGSIRKSGASGRIDGICLLWM